MNSRAAFAAFRSLTRYASRTANQRTIQTYKPFPRIQPLSTSTRRSTTSPAVPEAQANTSKPLTDRTPNSPSEPRPGQPEYQITFTCTPCGARSSHRVSKQGYHHGSTLITCPECRNRHIISDHLNVFGDKSLTIEDLMRDKGMLVKKGTLSEDGDVEFWEDGTTTRHKKSKEEDVVP